MSSKIKQYALRCHNDVQDAVDELLSYERDGISANHVICEAILFYAKHKRNSSNVTAKPITPVVVDRVEAAKAKWTKNPEPVYEEEVLDENGYVIS